jgi:hypothetical protein
MIVLDLKMHSGICKPSRRIFPGRSDYVYRPACIYPSHGLHAVENLSALRGAVPRQFQRQELHLPRPIPSLPNGVRNILWL